MDGWNYQNDWSWEQGATKELYASIICYYAVFAREWDDNGQDYGRLKAHQCCITELADKIKSKGVSNSVRDCDRTAHRLLRRDQFPNLTVFDNVAFDECKQVSLRPPDLFFFLDDELFDTRTLDSQMWLLSSRKVNSESGSADASGINPTSDYDWNTVLKTW